jgi:hypothetical protein
MAVLRWVGRCNDLSPLWRDYVTSTQLNGLQIRVCELLRVLTLSNRLEIRSGIVAVDERGRDHASGERGSRIEREDSACVDMLFP